MPVKIEGKGNEQQSGERCAICSTSYSETREREREQRELIDTS
jgi:hypothetical protein